MNKLAMPIFACVLVATIAFLLYDGGYLARWTGHAEKEVRAEVESVPSETVPPAVSGDKEVEPRQGIDRISFGSGMAVFGVAIVLAALIKLIAKFIPSVIRHERPGR